MAQDWQALPVASTTGVNRAVRTLVDPVESLGRPDDSKATSIADRNSVVSLLKGCLDVLGVPIGGGQELVNIARTINADLLDTLGDTADAPAASLTASASAIALTKRVLVLGGL